MDIVLIVCSYPILSSHIPVVKSVVIIDGEDRSYDERVDNDTVAAVVGFTVYKVGDRVRRSDAHSIFETALVTVYIGANAVAGEVGIDNGSFPVEVVAANMP